MNTSLDAVDLIKSENFTLKKRLNEEDNTIKKLNTRIQKLTHDLKQAKLQQGVPLKVTAESIKQEELIYEYEEQIKHLSKLNTSLKAQLLQQNYTNLGLPRSNMTPYERALQNQMVKSSPKNATSSYSKTKAKGGNEIRFGNPDKLNDDADREEVAKLQDLVNLLRQKLNEAEAEKDIFKTELEQFKTTKLADLESLLLKSDVDKIALQKLLHEKQKLLDDLEKNYPQAKNQAQNLTDTNQKLRADLESTRSELKKELDLRLQLEERIIMLNNGQEKVRSLESIIQELRKENEFLKQEQARFFSSSKSGQAHIEREEQIKKLQEKVNDLESSLSALKEHEKNLKDHIKSLEESLKEKEKQARHDEARTIGNISSLDKILGKLLKTFLGEDFSDLDDVLELIKLLRRGKLNAGYENDHHVERMRADYIRTMEELGKMKKQFPSQNALNKKEKNEIATATQADQLKLDSPKKDSEEKSRVNNQHSRLQMLQDKLSRSAAKDTKFMLETIPEMHPYDSNLDKLTPGQNIIEIQILEAKINPTNFKTPTRRPQVFSSRLDDYLITFVTFDFLDFAPQVSCFASGPNPQYKFTSKFKITCDDFFLEYCSTARIKFELYRCIGTEYDLIGFCETKLKDVLTSPVSNSFEKNIRAGDIRSAYDHRQTIGQLSFAFKAQHPIEKTYSQFIESRVARLSAGNSAYPDSLRSQESNSEDAAHYNTLDFNFGKAYGVNLPDNTANVYIMFDFSNFGDFLSEASRVIATGNRVFDVYFEKSVSIPVIVDHRFYNFLQNSEVELKLIAETFPESRNSFVPVGTCTINFKKLAHGQRLRLEVPFNNGSGSLKLNIGWRNPLELDVKNKILEKAKIKRNSKESVGTNALEEFLHHAVDSKARTLEKNEPDLKLEDELEQRLEDLRNDVFLKDEMSQTEANLPIPVAKNETPTTDDEFKLPLSPQIDVPEETDKQSLKSTSNAGTLKSNGRMSLAEDPLTPISIRVDSITLNSAEQTPYIEDLLKVLGLKRLFVSFRFLDYPLEELESPSFAFDGSQNMIKTNFEKEFKFTDLSQMQKLESFLASDDPTIVFSIVSEPQGDDEDQVCIDFGLASYHLNDFMDEVTNNEGQYELDLVPNVEDEQVSKIVKKEDASIPFGRLNIKFSGWDLVYDLIEGEPDKEIDEQQDVQQDLASASSQKDTLQISNGSKLPIVRSYSKLQSKKSPTKKSRRSISFELPSKAQILERINNEARGISKTPKAVEPNSDIKKSANIDESNIDTILGQIFTP
ncbi:hypothetical protein MP638_003912 [Amoeboaphelidium occidentale]|nr:hypothetical protein MP638_003912 [Amoeboaphelidium occidentale]